MSECNVCDGVIEEPKPGQAYPRCAEHLLQMIHVCPFAICDGTTCGGKVSTEFTEGTKFDTNKNRLELISPFAEWGLGLILTYGARKYAPRNWEQGINFTRVIGAIKRHLNAIERGEDLDPETGLSHADHLFTEAMFLSHFFQLYEDYKVYDDRPTRRS